MLPRSGSLPLTFAHLMLSLVKTVSARIDSAGFPEFQNEYLNKTLPHVPIRLPVFGSIFQTAYYFVDLDIGAPDPQSISMIIDTGSSTQGIPCHDCESCGHSHWDDYYDRTKSEFNRRMPCGECQTCRLNTGNKTLEALVTPLIQFVDEPAAFNAESAKLLLSDPGSMQCLYHVSQRLNIKWKVLAGTLR